MAEHSIATLARIELAITAGLRAGNDPATVNTRRAFEAMHPHERTLVAQHVADALFPEATPPE